MVIKKNYKKSKRAIKLYDNKVKPKKNYLSFALPIPKNNESHRDYKRELIEQEIDWIKFHRDETYDEKTFLQHLDEFFRRYPALSWRFDEFEHRDIYEKIIDRTSKLFKKIEEINTVAEKNKTETNYKANWTRFNNDLIKLYVTIKDYEKSPWYGKPLVDTIKNVDKTYKKYSNFKTLDKDFLIKNNYLDEYQDKINEIKVFLDDLKNTKKIDTQNVQTMTDNPYVFKDELDDVIDEEINDAILDNIIDEEINDVSNEFVDKTNMEEKAKFDDFKSFVKNISFSLNLSTKYVKNKQERINNQKEFIANALINDSKNYDEYKQIINSADKHNFIRNGLIKYLDKNKFNLMN